MWYRYRASTPTFFTVSASVDEIFFVISGSATRTRIVRTIEVSTIQVVSALGTTTVVARKFSTAPTGGTASDLTRTPLDSAYPAAATDGLVRVYSAAPTEGTLVGTIMSRKLLFKNFTVADGAHLSEANFSFNFGSRRKRLNVAPPGIYLHDTAEAVGIGLGLQVAASSRYTISVEWLEGS